MFSYNTIDTCISHITIDTCISYNTIDTCISHNTIDTCISYNTIDTCISHNTIDTCISYVWDTCIYSIVRDQIIVWIPLTELTLVHFLILSKAWTWTSNTTCLVFNSLKMVRCWYKILILNYHFSLFIYEASFYSCLIM
jgi:hypothetical protein